MKNISKLLLVVILFGACASLFTFRIVTVSAEDSPAAPESATIADDKKPLAIDEHDVGEVEVAILEVQRTPGDMLTVRWQYQNKSAEKKVVVETEAGNYGFGLARSVYLVDPINKKKYLTVEDSERQPLAAKLGNYGKVEIEAGKTVKTWAKFPAPPLTVQKVSIYIPGVAPFEEVPIKG